MTPVAAPDGVGVATLPSTDDALAFERRPDAPDGVLGRSRAEHATRPASLSAAPGHSFEEEREPAGARVLRLAHGRLTLDELVSGAWAAIGAGFPAACPVCDGPMSPNSSAPAACGTCGAELS
jgi:hypothetical protein